MVQKYCGLSQESGIEILIHPYQEPTMELFAENGYFRKKLHLMLKYVWKDSEYASASFENTTNPSNEKESGSHKITSKTSAMKVFF